MLKKFSQVNFDDLKLHFSNLEPEDEGYVFLDNDKIVAFMYIQKCNIGEQKGIYLHKPTFIDIQQNDEILTLFLQEIEKDYASSFVATNEKSKVYEDFGYNYAFELRHFCKKIKDSLFCNADYDSITANTLYNLRESYIDLPYLQPEKQDYKKTILQLYSQGASTVSSDYGYAIYYRTSEKLIVKELFAKNETAAINLIKAISNHNSRDLVEIFLPTTSEICCAEGDKIYSGMIKNYNLKNIFNGIIEV